MRLNMSVQSELHGLAALQWSICLDSLCRYICNVLDISKFSCNLPCCVLHRIEDTIN